MFANHTNKLCLLASKGDKNALRSLLRKTIWRSRINTEDQNGNTPLTWAVIYGCVDTVLLLLDNGANINARGKDGATLLHWAARYGHIGIITLLLEKGMDINVQQVDNSSTPLHWSVQSDNEQIVSFLLAKGAKIDAIDNEGNTPL